jgi:hypothetical protein
MFETTFGISSRTFLKSRVFPALPTDQFNDNKCCYCWSPYNDTDHPGVRILPCNHVIGRDCLKMMVAAKGGDLCPLCRVSLFRPRPREGQRWLVHYRWVFVFVAVLQVLVGVAMVILLVGCRLERDWRCYY